MNLIRNKLDKLKDVYQQTVSPDNNTRTDKALDGVISVLSNTRRVPKMVQLLALKVRRKSSRISSDMSRVFKTWVSQSLLLA